MLYSTCLLITFFSNFYLLSTTLYHPLLPSTTTPTTLYHPLPPPLLLTTPLPLLYPPPLLLPGLWYECSFHLPRHRPKRRQDVTVSGRNRCRVVVPRRRFTVVGHPRWCQRLCGSHYQGHLSTPRSYPTMTFYPSMTR